MLLNKFVAGSIVGKFSPSWWKFSTTLKHQRQEMSIESLIGPLNVEEKVMAKDTRAKGA